MSPAPSTVPWWRQPAALALIAANCVPLAGLLFFNWNLFGILLLFWIDTLVIGLYEIQRLTLAIRLGGAGPGREPIEWHKRQEWQKRQVSGFAFAYYFFALIHGFFIILMFGSFESFANVLLQPEYVLAVLALVASRGYDLYADWRQPKILARMTLENSTAFVRVVVLQLALLAGAFGIALLRAPAAVLVALVLLKSAGDIFIYVSGHRRLARP